MVDVVPFQGFRPPANLVQKVSVVPYDVIESDEARKAAEGNPYSFFHVSKPEIDLDPALDPYHESVYQKGAENLRRLVAEKVLAQDPSPCYYIYKQRMGNHEQVGLMVGASVDEYEHDIIKKNEQTREDKELDRTRHVETLNSNTGPVFLIYRQNQAIDDMIARLCRQEKPVYEFDTSDIGGDVHHTFWAISNAQDVQKLKDAFLAVPFLYVADGHHRSAAGTRVCQKKRAANPLHTGKEMYNYFLAVIFPHDKVQVMAYNRFVFDLHGLSADDFLARLGAKFTIEPTDVPEPPKKHEFGMLFKGKWHRLKVKPEMVDESDVIARLDVNILQSLVLSPILGIENPRKDKRIVFIGGLKGKKGVEDAAVKHPEGVGFLLYPVPLEALMDVSDAGKMMPPKSTWFEPKLRCGIVIKPLV